MSSQHRQGIAPLVPSFIEIGIDGNRSIETSQGSGVILLQPLDDPIAMPNQWLFGPQGQCPLKTGDRLRVLFELGEGLAPLIPRLIVIGI